MDDKKIPDWSKFAPSNFSDIRGLISCAAAFISVSIIGHSILEEYTKTLFYKIDFSHIEISSEKQIPFYIVVILVGFLAVFTNYSAYCSFKFNTQERAESDTCQSDIHMLKRKNHPFLYLSFSLFIAYHLLLILLSISLSLIDVSLFKNQILMRIGVLIVIVVLVPLGALFLLYKKSKRDSFKLLSKWLIVSELFQGIVLGTLLFHQNGLFDFLYRSILFQWIEFCSGLYIVFVLPGFMFRLIGSLSNNQQSQSIGDWLRGCFERIKNEPTKTCGTILGVFLLIVFVDYMVLFYLVPVHQTVRFDRVTTITQKEGSTQAYFIAYETDDKYCLEPAEINEDAKKIVVYTTVQVWIDKNGVLTTQISSEDKSKYTIETSDDNPSFKLEKIYHIDT
ncbi:hypothetical protein [Lancefieldella rimae]|uniref:hypothetical protein n=1 Tax=Lancefieldella rimae TaxID=1383 RepID=UPI002880722D|nr:hypothetical protein [Lancefieldella rimae]